VTGVFSKLFKTVVVVVV